MPKMDLAQAGKLLGLSPNGMRARAKKDPSFYQLETDNAGKLWVVLDPSKLPDVKATLKPTNKTAKATVEPTLVVENAVLRSRVELLEADRDHWRDLAKSLAGRRRWWPF